MLLHAKQPKSNMVLASENYRYMSKCLVVLKIQWERTLQKNHIDCTCAVTLKSHLK